MKKFKNIQDVLFRKSKGRKKFFSSILFILSTLCSTVYLVWRLLYTLPFRYGVIAVLLGSFLLLAEIMAALESIIQYRQINKNMVPEMPVIPDSFYPDVDIFIATHNESEELLYKTINACNYLNYPDKSKVHIYVCDDSNRPEIAKLADRLNVNYFGLEHNTQAKAGNLNNAMKKTDSPLVATLDADMIPTSDFLMKTVPYFFLPVMKKDIDTGCWVERKDFERDKNFKIGFIQAPQSFYNPDLFQYYLCSETRIPNEQDYFFREVNVGRNADNAPIYAGSNTVLSRRALEEVGYIATTSITEDYLTGMRIQKKGYTTYAIPCELVHGLAPNTVAALLKQRERWGRGCIQSLRQEKLLTDKRLKFWGKVSYIATWSHWWTFSRRFIYIIAPICAILFNLPVMDASALEILMFWAPHYFLNNHTLRTISQGVRNKHWSNVYDTIMFPYLVGPIVMETLGIKKRKFVVTDKKKTPGKKEEASFLFALPHIELFAACVLSIFICIKKSILMNTIYSPVIFFWLLVNTKNLMFAIFFMLGRKNYRVSDRYYTGIDVEIGSGNRVINAVTSDVSETGMAILVSKPVFVSPDEDTRICVRNNGYTAEMKARLVHVIKVKDYWKYSIHITEIDENNYSRYMQVVYDREHTMPKSLPPSLSVFDDFNINLTKKFLNPTNKSALPSMRVLPRIQLNIPFELQDGRKGLIIDFNYYYVKLNCHITMQPNEILEFNMGSGIRLCLSGFTDDFWKDKNLYKVYNLSDFIDSPKTDEILDSWVELPNRDTKATASGIITMLADPV